MNLRKRQQEVRSLQRVEPYINLHFGSVRLKRLAPSILPFNSKWLDNCVDWNPESNYSDEPDSRILVPLTFNILIVIPKIDSSLALFAKEALRLLMEPVEVPFEVGT